MNWLKRMYFKMRINTMTAIEFLKSKDKNLLSMEVFRILILGVPTCLVGYSLARNIDRGDFLNIIVFSLILLPFIYFGIIKPLKGIMDHWVFKDISEKEIYKYISKTTDGQIEEHVENVGSGLQTVKSIKISLSPKLLEYKLELENYKNRLEQEIYENFLLSAKVISRKYIESVEEIKSRDKVLKRILIGLAFVLLIIYRNGLTAILFILALLNLLNKNYLMKEKDRLYLDFINRLGWILVRDKRNLNELREAMMKFMDYDNIRRLGQDDLNEYLIYEFERIGLESFKLAPSSHYKKVGILKKDRAIRIDNSQIISLEEIKETESEAGSRSLILISIEGFNKDAERYALEKGIELITTSDIRNWSNFKYKRDYPLNRNGFYEAVGEKLLDYYTSFEIEEELLEKHENYP